MAIILGIDPGSRFAGWGVVETSVHAECVCLGHGVLELPERESLAVRLSRLDAGLEQIVRKFQPEVFSVEKVFLGKNVASAFTLGHARGVVLAVAGRFALPVYEYATRSAKKMITGNGAASKEQVQLLVQNLLRVRETRLDATDALAMAICHAREVEVREKLGGAINFGSRL